MTIASFSNGSAPQGDGAEVLPLAGATTASEGALGTDGVPLSLREERLEAQIAQFIRAGYRVEQQTHLKAVVIREHKRTALSRVTDVARTFGTSLIVGAPRAYHRVLITIDTDGSVRLL